jgi:predicted 3-demethylubiquinone-9 3-methyltransferase (glyoxalase superfamily)
MQKIIPHLWFDKNAEEAAAFYVETFGGTLGQRTHYTEVGQDIHGMTPGTVMNIQFELNGFSFIGLNGGPVFSFTPAISFMVRCKDAEEVNELWKKLSAEGKVLMPVDTYPFSDRYGWVQDKYGVSWQLIVAAGPRFAPSLMYTGAVVGKAQEALTFYTSVFKHSAIGMLAQYGPDQEPNTKDMLMYGDFTIDGQTLVVMDSALQHDFTFNEAISLLVECEDQAEIDSLWEQLSADPKAEQCGWIKDKYGVSWQIAPKGMQAMLNNPDQEKAKRAFAAMMQMKKIDIATLQDAFEGK